MGLYISQFIAPFVGLAYPAYASFKAIESPQPEDDLQWYATVTLHIVVNNPEYQVDLLGMLCDLCSV